jgi:hypothetical protein
VNHVIVTGSVKGTIPGIDARRVTGKVTVKITGTSNGNEVVLLMVLDT